MVSVRPALGTWLDSLRRAATGAPIAETRIKRYEQPVPKVARNPNHDTFETAADELKHGMRRDLNSAPRDLRSARQDATPAPKPGATNATQFLHRDGFEAAARKPVELSPKPPPSFKPAVAVFRFR